MASANNNNTMDVVVDPPPTENDPTTTTPKITKEEAEEAEEEEVSEKTVQSSVSIEENGTSVNNKEESTAPVTAAESNKQEPTPPPPPTAAPPAPPAAPPAPTPAPTPAPAAPTAAPSSNNPLFDDANEQLALLLRANRLTQNEVHSLQIILRENAALREKITKLKNLLGRSAKAQRETKLELDAARHRLDEAGENVRRLERRVETLSNRPTHMDLLADFETNFDRALLSLNNNNNKGQSGGEDPSSATTAAAAAAAAGAPSATAAATAAALQGGGGEEDGVVSSMLLNELSEARSRIERLEQLNSALLHRASKLERDNETLAAERDAAQSQSSHLALELRMAQMEAEVAARTVREKSASLEEMQLEIDLVTKSAMDANARARRGDDMAKTAQTDKAYVAELESRVAVLQEWALAAAEAKSAAQERARAMQEKIKWYEQTMTAASGGGGGLLDSNALDAIALGAAGLNSNNNNTTNNNNTNNISPRGRGSSTMDVLTESEHLGSERRLWTKTSSLVVGAGMVESRIISLLNDDENENDENNNLDIDPDETVLLRWKFDLTPNDLDILFSILKGRHYDATKFSLADALMNNRTVLGGGGGEVTGAFAIQNACTMVWSNTHSWIRPRTVKYTVEAYAVH